MMAAGLIVFCLILAAAAGSDVARYRIPNALCLALAACAFVFALPHDGAAWAGRGLSLAVLGGTALVLYLMRALGGGDAKLLMAAALWMPWTSLPVFVFVLALAGGVQALASLALRRLAGPAPAAGRTRMPYGVSIAAAGFAWALSQWAAS
jgi:prepilin peptidase CpaA